MKVLATGRTDIGLVRKENQDSHVIHHPDGVAQRQQRGVLIAVADGMGGLEGGRLASQVSVETLEAAYYEEAGSAAHALEQAVKKANHEVHKRALELDSGKMMGSTMTALCIVGHSAWIAQVGDSRAYLYRGGSIRQITKDHSLVQELAERRGEMGSPALEWELKRNIITRGLGLEADVQVDLFEVDDLREDDTFLLSSDGFHELLADREMVTKLQQSGADLDQACGEFVELARERGAPDNVTVVLVRLTTEDDGRAVRAAAAGMSPEVFRTTRTWVFPLLLFVAFGAGVLMTLGLGALSRPDRATLDAVQKGLEALSREAETLEPDVLRRRLKELHDDLSTDATTSEERKTP